MNLTAVSMTSRTNRSSKNWSISSFDAIYEHYFGRVGRPHRQHFAVAQTRGGCIDRCSLTAELTC
jgi:hypothetical protein